MSAPRTLNPRASTIDDPTERRFANLEIDDVEPRAVVPPQITSITYGRTISVGRFESVRFDLVARVPDGIAHAAVLSDLRAEADRIEGEERRRHVAVAIGEGEGQS